MLNRRWEDDVRLVRILRNLAYDLRICNAEYLTKKASYKGKKVPTPLPWQAELDAVKNHPMSTALKLACQMTGMKRKSLAAVADGIKVRRHPSHARVAKIFNACDDEGRTGKMLRQLIEQHPEAMRRMDPKIEAELGYTAYTERSSIQEIMSQ